MININCLGKKHVAWNPKNGISFINDQWELHFWCCYHNYRQSLIDDRSDPEVTSKASHCGYSSLSIFFVPLPINNNTIQARINQNILLGFSFNQQIIILWWWQINKLPFYTSHNCELTLFFLQKRLTTKLSMPISGLKLDIRWLWSSLTHVGLCRIGGWVLELGQIKTLVI